MKVIDHVIHNRKCAAFFIAGLCGVIFSIIHLPDAHAYLRLLATSTFAIYLSVRAFMRLTDPPILLDLIIFDMAVALIIDIGG